MTDQKVIESILAGGSPMHKTIEWFYHANYSLIYKMISTHKVSKEEALDAYSDAITWFGENIKNQKFRGESKCSTYFIRIFNNKCVDIIRKKTTNRVNQNLIFLEDMRPESIQIEEEQAQKSLFDDSLKELGGICMDVLMDWSDGYSMDEIAERNGFRNAHTARSKRYNCFQQLMEILKKRKIVDANFNLTTDGE